MIQSFEVALLHCILAESRILAAKGRHDCGRMDGGELLNLLRAFQDTNPIQSFEGDPEIQITTRYDRFTVRTDLRRLMLYDVRNPSAPAMVLPPEELLAEVNGSAGKARMNLLQKTDAAPAGAVSRKNATSEASTGPVQLSHPAEAPRSRPWLRLALAVAVVLFCMLGVFLFRGPSTPALDSYLEADAEVASRRQDLAGVYTTGDEPGDRGLVIMSSGMIRLFQLQKDVPPSMRTTSYRLGWLRGRLCLQIDEPDGIIQVETRNSLLYGGRSYHRLPQ